MRKTTFVVFILFLLIFSAQLGAQTWQATKRLTWNSGYSGVPAMASDSNDNIHVVYLDLSPGNWELYYKRSTNGGATWSTERLTWNSGNSTDPDITSDANNNIHVVWMDYTPGNYEIYYKKSTDSGNSWSANKRLTWKSGTSEAPAIYTDSNNNIFVIWDDEYVGNYEIYLKKSTDGGTSWTTKRLTWSSGDSWEPCITMDSSDNIHVIWRDFYLLTPLDDDLYYKKSTDGGTSWTATKRLTWNPGYSGWPDIAADSSDNIHVVWNDQIPGTQEIYYKKSTNGGATWTTKRLTWNSGLSNKPAIATDANDNIHIVWRDDSPSNDEIYYKRSTNGGTTWADKRLTWNSGSSVSTVLALDSANVIHVIWSDDTPGNNELYYKKGIQ
jgi:hypothetical protein